MILKLPHFYDAYELDGNVTLLLLPAAYSGEGWAPPLFGGQAAA